MSDILESLAITNWYKAVVAVSGTAFLIALGITAYGIALTALGVFLLGLGIWESHRKSVEIGRMGQQIIKKTDIVYQFSLVGTLLQLFGCAVAAYGVYRIVVFGP